MKCVLKSGLLGILLMIANSCTTVSVEDKQKITAEFNQFLDAQFDEMLSYSPQGLAYFGKKEKYNQLDDQTEAFDFEMQKKARKNFQELKKFQRQNLDAQAQLS